MAEIEHLHASDEEGCAAGAALPRPRRLSAANDNPSPIRRRVSLLIVALLCLSALALIWSGR